MQRGVRLFHAFMVEAEVVAAMVLGLVHGHVGLVDQRDDVAGLIGVDGNTDRRGDIKLVSSDQVGLAYMFDELFRHVTCIVGILDVVDQQQELVTTLSAQRVGCAD